MSATESTSQRITLYDIAQRPPVEKSCCAPNPWKARFALNFKRLPYSTTWVGMLDIGRVRRSLGASACRKFADGGDFYTLPIVRDPSTGAVLGDSFDIAAYLEETYPGAGGGSLFPELPALDGFAFAPTVDFPTLLTLPRDGRHPRFGRFNLAVDTLFTTFAALAAGGMPLDPATADKVKAEFARRAGAEPGGEDFKLEGEARRATLEGFEAALGGLAGLFEGVGGSPFVLGKQVSYADFIVGAWLRMYCVTLSREEWERLRGWHGGVFGRLHDALDAYAQIQ
ncbi:Glutathione S-transferase [Cordyceps fumosorosea ARSEF 2679]|uniref:Glutathione S-transferase n=1 Tax=Cordyceps fumosorosea (strain ARSEF 2679) TaxID=1081104 RepID=A0A168B8H7_CORFA|nr:Glutathione S-transferase [Cordyceps fumosorosea ARSEF 2679]OAA69767.1 Glutathione S-transferase [Cordyceps fumosorosea ARSEF 2679]